jgi:hypothetical protein
MRDNLAVFIGGFDDVKHTLGAGGVMRIGIIEHKSIMLHNLDLPSTIVKLIPSARH